MASSKQSQSMSLPKKGDPYNKNTSPETPIEKELNVLKLLSTYWAYLKTELMKKDNVINLILEFKPSGYQKLENLIKLIYSNKIIINSRIITQIYNIMEYDTPDASSNNRTVGKSLLHLLPGGIEKSNIDVTPIQKKQIKKIADLLKVLDKQIVLISATELFLKIRELSAAIPQSKINSEHKKNGNANATSTNTNHTRYSANSTKKLTQSLIARVNIVGIYANNQRNNKNLSTNKAIKAREAFLAKYSQQPAIKQGISASSESRLTKVSATMPNTGNNKQSLIARSNIVATYAKTPKLPKKK